MTVLQRSIICNRANINDSFFSSTYAVRVQKISLTDLDHRLTMPECLRSRYQSGRCRVCSTPVCRLRQAAYDDITCMAVGYNDTTMSHFINPATSPFGSQSSSYRYVLFTSNMYIYERKIFRA